MVGCFDGIPSLIRFDGGMCSSPVVYIATLTRMNATD